MDIDNAKGELVDDIQKIYHRFLEEVSGKPSHVLAVKTVKGQIREWLH